MEPYSAQQQFIGLYTIKQGKKLDIHFDNGLIPRDAELAYLKLLLCCFFVNVSPKEEVEEESV